MPIILDMDHQQKIGYGPPTEERIGENGDQLSVGVGMEAYGDQAATACNQLL